MQEGKSLVCCSAGGGGGDVKRTTGLYMLERCNTCSGANWGQFQQSSLSLWSLRRAGWKTSCFPHQERRKGRRCGWEALRSLPDNLNLIQHKPFPSLQTEYFIFRVPRVLCFTVAASTFSESHPPRFVPFVLVMMVSVTALSHYLHFLDYLFCFAFKIWTLILPQPVRWWTCVWPCGEASKFTSNAACVIPNQLHDVIKVFGSKLLCL